MVASVSAPRRRKLAVAGLVLAIGAVLADSSVVVLALPDMLGTFNTTVSRVAWVITAFNLFPLEAEQAIEQHFTLSETLQGPDGLAFRVYDYSG